MDNELSEFLQDMGIDAATFGDYEERFRLLMTGAAATADGSVSTSQLLKAYAAIDGGNESFIDNIQKRGFYPLLAILLSTVCKAEIPPLSELAAGSTIHSRIVGIKQRLQMFKKSKQTDKILSFLATNQVGVFDKRSLADKTKTFPPCDSRYIVLAPAVVVERGDSKDGRDFEEGGLSKEQQCLEEEPATMDQTEVAFRAARVQDQGRASLSGTLYDNKPEEEALAAPVYTLGPIRFSRRRSSHAGGLPYPSLEAINMHTLSHFIGQEANPPLVVDGSTSGIKHGGGDVGAAANVFEDDGGEDDAEKEANDEEDEELFEYPGEFIDFRTHFLRF